MYGLLISEHYDIGLTIAILACYGMLFSLQCRFLLSLARLDRRRRDYGCFLLLSFANLAAASFFQFEQLLLELFTLGITLIFVRFVLRQSYALTILSGLLINATVQIASGIIAPLNYLCYQNAVSLWVNEVLVIASFLLVIGLLSIMYCLLTKKIELKITKLNYYFLIPLVPFLLMLTFSRLIEAAGYWSVTTVMDTKLNQIQMFFQSSFGQELLIACMSLVAFGCIFASLFAYQKVIQFFEVEQKRTLLEQQIYAQENYMNEAKLRVGQTLAFRHDFKKHLSVVNGLLQGEHVEEAVAYLDKMERITGSLSFSCSTGNLTIDTLFSNKLSVAEQMGIHVVCDAVIPGKINLDDLDLCVIFANALDNAISACRLTEGAEKFIRVSTRVDGNFFMIEVSNSYNPQEKPVGGSGLGISNMRQVVQKYNGALSIEQTADCFRLDILLILSGRSDDISGQISLE